MRMINEPILKTNTISLEGPDLSGKTTLYSKIHALTGFKWDIRDRSFLSRVCFARQFNRDESRERSRLEEELSNVNNRVIVLLPSFEVLSKRIIKRGDKIQTLETLKSLHEIYEEETSRIENLPNVLVVREVREDLPELCVKFLHSLEKNCSSDAGRLVRDLVARHQKDELSVQCRLSGKLTKPESSEILQNDLEGSYYREIMWDFENVIRKELRGLNPYGKNQDMKSRRFYYSSSSCISSIHLMPRGDHVKCSAVFRSTNVEVNAAIDIEFLNFLVRTLSKKYFLDCKTYEIDLKLNSAHIMS